MRDKDTIGKIINIGSTNSSFGGTTVPAYSATKGAVTQPSKNIAPDYTGYSICCNVIAPGYTDTEMCVNMSQERKDRCAKRIAVDRQGRSGDSRGPILFLTSSAGDYLSGTVILIDGGFLVKSQEADQTNLKAYNR